MSDARVLTAIEQMEAWLGDQNWEPDPQALGQWNADFQAALAQAEKARSGGAGLTPQASCWRLASSWWLRNGIR